MDSNLWDIITLPDYGKVDFPPSVEVIEVSDEGETRVEIRDLEQGLEGFTDFDDGFDDGVFDDAGNLDKPDQGPCISDCTGKMCGDDGCGGLCGYRKHGKVCKDGQCVEICVPDCVAKQKLCGPGGCGGE